MSFQKAINRDLPRGVAGDFASTNPRNSMLAGEGSLRSQVLITVGQFAFADLGTGLVTNIFSAGMSVGFVHRNNQAVVPVGLSASMIIPAGREITLFSSGDFYVVCPATVAAGDAVYALDATGAVSAVAASAQATNFKFAEPGTAGKLVKITRLSV